MIAPGMSIIFKIEFFADSFAEISDEIIII